MLHEWIKAFRVQLLRQVQRAGLRVLPQHATRVDQSVRA